MGQQQLLLIVLGVIVVAIAVVAGIGLFNANAEESVKDELTNQCVAIGAHAQQYYKKPVAMGGGGLSFQATDAGGAVTKEYSIPRRMKSTQNCGTFAADGLPTGTADDGYILAITDKDNLTITAKPNTASYLWTIVTTVTPDNITTEVQTTTAGQ